MLSPKKKHKGSKILTAESTKDHSVDVPPYFEQSSNSAVKRSFRLNISNLNENSVGNSDRTSFQAKSPITKSIVSNNDQQRVRDD